MLPPEVWIIRRSQRIKARIIADDIVSGKVWIGLALDRWPQYAAIVGYSPDRTRFNRQIGSAILERQQPNLVDRSAPLVSRNRSMDLQFITACGLRPIPIAGWHIAWCFRRSGCRLRHS